jgi:predicted transcriptional regulator of viral defense system
MTTNKSSILLKDGRCLYHVQDLAVLWNINNSNTLHTTISRYIRRGVLNNIYKGFYSTKPLSEINPLLLGLTSIHRYGYLSTESVLIEEGVIFQDIKYITIVSNISKRFQINQSNFLVRKIKEVYLKNKTGVLLKNGIRRATLERAVADLLYFNPDYYLDNTKNINWKKVKEIQKIIGY